MISHRLGERFNSPTVNLWIRHDEFIKFVKNLHYYLSLDLSFIDTELDYPVGLLDDVRIYFNHYKCIGDAREQWEKRKKRVDYNNLYIILSGVGDMSEETIKELDEVKCRNKIVLSSRPHPDIDYVLMIKPHERRADGFHYMDRTIMMGWAFEKNFDYVTWLNEGAD